MNYKAALKAIAPSVGTLVAIAVEYLITKKFDELELTTALTGLSAALLTLITPNDTNADGLVDKTPLRLSTDRSK